MKSINIKFPIEDDPEKNRLFKMTLTTKDAIQSDLMLLFKTKKGVRYYMYDYGTNLEKFIFQPDDNVTENEIIEDLRQSVRSYMPNVQIDTVKFYNNESKGYEDLEDNEIRVQIFFTYTDDAFRDTGKIEITY
jgi:phage baseplate assembly protein W